MPVAASYQPRPSPPNRAGRAYSPAIVSAASNRVLFWHPALFPHAKEGVANDVDPALVEERSHEDRHPFRIAVGQRLARGRKLLGRREPHRSKALKGVFDPTPNLPHEVTLEVTPTSHFPGYSW